MKINHGVIGFILSIVFCLSCFIISYSDNKTSNTDKINLLSGKVIKVYDGDTITIVTPEKRQIKVRLKNIDSPEKKQDYGTQAKNFTSSLIFGKQVKLSSSGKDKYGREIAEIFIDDTNINKEIVKNGYAWAYRDFLDDKNYIQLEQQAKNAKLGLWAGNNPIEPSKWRKLNK